MCEEGADVLITGRIEEKLIAVCTELNNDCPGTAEYIVTDLSESDSANKLYGRNKKAR